MKSIAGGLIPLAFAFLTVPARAQTGSGASPHAATNAWRPTLLFGTVDYNEQFAVNPADWQKSIARADGMLLHIHFWVRHRATPGNRVVAEAEKTERAIAPSLRGKQNVVELTYDIRDARSSPEAIGRDHAAQVEKLESDIGVPISAVDADWILGGFKVQAAETPRRDGESDLDYEKRIVEGVIDKSRRYVAAFRAAGRKEKLIAVFPPIYLDEGRWVNARHEKQFGRTTSGILNGLFDAGFDGFTADSPNFVLTNAAYRAVGYYEALHSIEATCHRRGKSFGLIVNGDNAEMEPDRYDALFQRKTLESLDLVVADGIRPDTLVVESWYRGPYHLTPEDQPDTFTNTVLKVARRIDAASASPP